MALDIDLLPAARGFPALLRQRLPGVEHLDPRTPIRSRQHDGRSRRSNFETFDPSDVKDSAALDLAAFTE